MIFANTIYLYHLHDDPYVCICMLVYGPDRPPVHPPQERMRPILFCSWDLSEHEKWMPPSPNWDGLPVGRHFQNGRHRN